MRPSPPLSTSEQEFPYGWRFVKRAGSEELEQVALTLEDVLHPQEGDVIPESKPHEADRRYLMNILETIPLSPPHTLVTSDLIVHWGVEGMRDHAPDLAVFTGMKRDPEGIQGSLDLSAYGGKCQLIVELVSPSTRDNDVVKKKEHYHRLGIPLYIIFDQLVEGGPRFLRPHKHKPGGYSEIETDFRERVDVPFLGLMIGLRDNRVACYDLRTEEELGDYAAVKRQWLEDKRRLEAADLRDEQREQAMAELVETCHKTERRANEAELLAEQQRKAMEEAERKAADAQKLADEQRQEAERIQREADKQRLALEERDRRILELEARLRNLQTGGIASDPATPAS